jgi:NADH-quinone oxidoreductase subunit N
MFFFKESTFKSSEKVTITYNIVGVFVIASIVVLGVFPDLFARLFGL